MVLVVRKAIRLQKLQEYLYAIEVNESKKALLVWEFNDNQACMASLIKHELVRGGDIDILYVKTNTVMADRLSKGLEQVKHQNFLNMLSLSM